MTEKLIKIKHHLSSGCCMWSGIEDVYAMKTGQTIPQGFLLALSSYGETIFLKINNNEKPYMFSANDARPRTVYQNIKDELGLTYKIYGGRTIKFAMKCIKEEIDNNHPVILGPLDMFYLPYLSMYHKEHIPIHYVLMTGYNDEDNCVFIYDCDRENLIKLRFEDLQNAWNIDKNAVGDKNGFIKFSLSDNLLNKYELTDICLKKKAERQLREMPHIIGVSAYEKIAKEIPKWKKEFSEDDYRKALISITEFMGRVPKIPNKILGINKKDIPYKANYDRLSLILKELGSEYHKDQWLKASKLFEKCGNNINEIVKIIVSYCTDKHNDLQCLPQLFLQNADYAKEAYLLIQDSV